MNADEIRRIALYQKIIAIRQVLGEPTLSESERQDLTKLLGKWLDETIEKCERKGGQEETDG